MKIGCIGYSNNSGLGNYIANFRKHLPFDSQLIIKHPAKGTFPLDIPHSFGIMCAKDAELLCYLDMHNPTIVFIIETAFNDSFYRILHDRGVKVVYIPMIDCVSVDNLKSFAPYIDVVINHTMYGHDLYKPIFKSKAHYLPYPIDTNYFHPDRIDMPVFDFLHNQGSGGAGYRKATDQVFVSFRQFMYTAASGSMLVNSQPYEQPHSQLLKNISGVTIKIRDCVESIDVYKKGKVYVAPSRREGLGLPILEAMACGLPVITTDAPPMNEWFTDNSLLVPIQSEILLSYGDIPMYTPNAFELYQKMIYAYEHPKHMERIGKLNRKIIEEKFSWKVLKDKYSQILRKL